MCLPLKKGPRWDPNPEHLSQTTLPLGTELQERQGRDQSESPGGHTAFEHLEVTSDLWKNSVHVVTLMKTGYNGLRSSLGKMNPSSRLGE